MKTFIMSLMLACVAGLVSAEEKTEKLVIKEDAKRIVVEMDSEGDTLVVVDGKVFEGNLNDIKPETIESVKILKKEEAVKIYGEEAAKNGVIVITLKKK
jgi:hypothetical protein